MIVYLFRRLLLLPFTLLAILTINFVIINLAPGDPSTLSSGGEQGQETQGSENLKEGVDDDPFHLFRVRYGLNLPIIFNTWIWKNQSEVKEVLKHYLELESQSQQLKTSNTELRELKRSLNDRAQFQMRELLTIIEDQSNSFEVRKLATELMVKGATRLGISAYHVSAKERRYNQAIAEQNQKIKSWILRGENEDGDIIGKWRKLIYERFDLIRFHDAPITKKLAYSFTQTRYVKYLRRILSLDFGTIRNDTNRSVIQEVIQRLPISLTLAVFPMFLTFMFSLFFGLLMAVYHKKHLDLLLNLLFLILYATPVFVVGPFLIETLADKVYFPFTHTPIPSGNFHSPKQIFDQFNSFERFIDIAKHMFLPIIVVTYGTFAAKARLTRTAVLEVMRQDYILAAKARGIPKRVLLFKHILKNASITLVTAIAGSLSAILGGSLIVETLFEIDGFGKFFYEAILNRDINVIMFSTLMGSFLTLMGYLIADLTYTFLDPRVELE